MTETHINDLPLELFVEILIRTDGLTLGKSRRVCCNWKVCIDSTDHLWQEVCEREFKYSSRIAKKKCGSNCDWYHIYRNLKLWTNISSYELKVKEFYNFSVHDKYHALEIDHGILPLRVTRGIVLYDTSTLKYIPVVVPDTNCIRIGNNNHVSVILVKTSLYLQRTVLNSSHMSEAFFKADHFILSGNCLYFYNNRDVYKVDLMTENLVGHLVMTCHYNIKEMQYSDDILHLFTDCGTIVSLEKNKQVSEKSINCPPEWVRQIKHICAIDNRNFVCYSRNLFKVKTDKYEHLYLDFPPFTALFFYANFIIMGTKDGEILLYHLNNQMGAIKPVFQNLATLPEGKFAVQLDVCERKSGPLIIVATFFEILLLEVNFFPDEQADKSRTSFPDERRHMYKRLMRLKDRLQY